jgi:hypothetical protein
MREISADTRGKEVLLVCEGDTANTKEFETA